MLLPNVRTYQQSMMDSATPDNACVKIVRCNKMAVGYAHMYYNDFGNSEHSVSLCLYLDEKYLYKSAVKVMVDEAIEFFLLHKQNHNIECIKVCLNKYVILMSRYDFYKRCLLELGFEQKDKEYLF